jgi:hypothetical protein
LVKASADEPVQVRERLRHIFAAAGLHDAASRIHRARTPAVREEALLEFAA